MCGLVAENYISGGLGDDKNAFVHSIEQLDVLRIGPDYLILQLEDVDKASSNETLRCNQRKCGPYDIPNLHPTIIHEVQELLREKEMLTEQDGLEYDCARRVTVEA